MSEVYIFECPDVILLWFFFKYVSLQRYNKREDDFPSLAEYNDFLEEVEEIGKF